MNLCAKCARYERTCCQKTEIFVTDGDIQRIEAHVGRSDFWEYRKPADPDYLLEQPEDPRWLLYTLRADNTRPQLKQQPSGDCTFLTATGCSLPTTVRPLVCRLYPYNYTEQGISGTVSGCPLYLLDQEQTLFEAIGMNQHDAERWRRQLYNELRTGSVYDENRYHIRSSA